MTQRQGIPAVDCGNAFLQIEIARIRGLCVHRNRIAIGSGVSRMKAATGTPPCLDQAIENEFGAYQALPGNHVIQAQ
jgi:hypothetical protein